MNKKHQFAVGGLLVVCVAMISVAGCISESINSDETPIVEILYTGAGTMPGLLATGKIDGYIIWQPFVAVGIEGNIGRVISYSQDLPPAGMWEQHTCCAIGANLEALKATDLTTSIVALMILGDKYINDYPQKSAGLVADWLFSKRDMVYGNITINSVDVMNASIPTIMFSSEITDAWLASNEEFIKSLRELNLITGKLASSSGKESIDLLYDFCPYEAAISQIEGGQLVTPASVTRPISIGYLSSDHDAPLFVLLKDWQYFKDTYNSYFKPARDKAGKISEAELFINEKKIADVKFVEGSGGSQLMTLLSQNSIQYAVAGTSPYIGAIDKSTGVVSLKILAPIQLGGSGLVASVNSPAKNWASFVQWISDRSEAGNNVVIADPQLGSVQDVQLKAALKNAGITIVTMKQ
jgi:NitT/TauT family transport system substrate-binding protein